MKKTIIWICGALLTLACATAVYRFCFRKSIPDAQLPEQVAAILKQNDCFVCHSNSPKKPFYSSFPVIGKKMAKHIDHAVRFVELEEAVSTDEVYRPSEVLLAKIEHAMLAESMPIKEYRMIHWGTGFNREEKSVITRWIREVRERRQGSDAFAKLPVRPLPFTVNYNSDKAYIGEVLFNDTRISLDNTISCATCHILANGGADEVDERTSEGINGNVGGVNAPTVYNAVFNVKQFWNGRAADLSEQAAGPPVNPMEMGDQTWDQIIERLSKDKDLVEVFEYLYPQTGLTKESVTDAIAEYEKTLITPGARFDNYLFGNTAALSADEIDGFNLFLNNSCAVCHVGQNIGGQSFEYLGVFGDYFGDRDPSIERNADDDGLKGFTGEDLDLEKFKVPSLRNVALTAPYFHDGSQQTLEDAVRAMFKYELDKTPSEEHVNKITAFLRTLTGKHPSLKAE